MGLPPADPMMKANAENRVNPFVYRHLAGPFPAWFST